MSARASTIGMLSRNGLIHRTVSEMRTIWQARHKQLFFSTIKTGKDESLSILTQGFQPTAFTAEGVYIGSTYLASPPQTLPELDVSALTIDPEVFFTDNQAVRTAKREWEQKRRILMHTMKTELSINKESKKMYIVRNHGAPKQLLQHHLDIADQWLDEVDAMELTVENLYGTMHMDRFSTKAYDGINSFSLMPYKWSSDMELLITAMHRLATQLAALVFLPRKNSHHRPEDSDVDTQEGKAGEFSKCKQWTVICYGRNLLPPRLLPLGGDIVPVVEFIPAEGRVCIRLQGKLSAGKEDEAKLVSLVFNSVFEKRLHPTVHHGNFLW